jgi:hypothetical protein
MHPASRHIECKPVIEDSAKRRNKGITSRGVQSSHPFQVSRKVTLDHKVCNDHLVEQRRTWREQLGSATKAIDLRRRDDEIA